ncbi:hypothetical protein Tco_0814081 [Tanacetum coccineum]
MEKEVQELRNVDNSSTVISTIKSDVPNVVKEFLGTNMDDAHYKESTKKRPKDTITLADTDALEEFDQKTSLFETMTKTKPSQLELSKASQNLSQKSTGKSAQAEETVFEAGDTQGPQNLKDDMGNTDEPPVVNVDIKDWFKKLVRPFTLDPEWNKGKSVEDKPTQ